jgi:hypothetical protein
MTLEINVNGVAIVPGRELIAKEAENAGLRRASVLRRWAAALRQHDERWHVKDPQVRVFDDAVEIYPCKDAYLDPDRRWGTSCSVAVKDGIVRKVEIAVIDGKYAASNLFDRFVDGGYEILGDPQENRRGGVIWLQKGLKVLAALDRTAKNASFEVGVDESAR